MKYITIATDISFSAKYKIATWAVYIRYDGGAIKEVGEFKTKPKNTVVAETYALANALAIAKKNIPTFSQSRIIIHNEIEHVIRPMKTKSGLDRVKDAERTQAIRNTILPVLNEALSYDRRKIKAHYEEWRTSDNPAKYAMNRWCDEASRNLMRELRSIAIAERRRVVEENHLANLAKKLAL